MSRINGHPGAGIGIQLAPGANALTTAEAGQGRDGERRAALPAGYQIAYANDSTDFIKLSIDEVVKTLVEAIVLVILVMFVFLQSWRATLIPAIAVPVVLLGTFGVLDVARLLDQHSDPVRAGARRSACWSTTPSSWSRTSSG